MLRRRHILNHVPATSRRSTQNLLVNTEVGLSTAEKITPPQRLARACSPRSLKSLCGCLVKSVAQKELGNEVVFRYLKVHVHEHASNIGGWTEGGVKKWLKTHGVKE